MTAAQDWRWRRKVDLTGQRFGLLVATQTARLGNGEAGWRCVCDCGGESIVDTWRLRSGKSRSCGCQQTAAIRTAAKSGNQRTHGMKYTRVYRVWTRMKERCLRSSHKSFADYGGRGIRVCERWMSFENFYADMGEPPAGYTIERDEVNGHYEPGNCRWLPMALQYRNRRDSRFLTAFGETKTAVEWSEDSRCAANYTALTKRLEAGWDDVRAITQPMKADRRREVAR